MDANNISTDIYSKYPEKNLLNVSLSEKQKSNLNSGLIGLGGMIAGAGLFSLFGGAVRKDGSEVFPENNEDCEDVVLETSLPFSETVSDEMDFQEAFSTAREELGAGGFFNWKGNSYNTYYKEEWEEMSSEEQLAYGSNVQSHSLFVDVDININIEQTGSVQEVEQAETAEDTPSESISGAELSPFEELTFGISDTDDNGIIDSVVVDADQDGYADTIMIDVNEDGEIDLQGIDIDYDGDIDVVIVDEGQDGLDENDTHLEYDGVVSMDDFIIVDEDGNEVETSNQIKTNAELGSDVDIDLDDVELFEI